MEETNKVIDISVGVIIFIIALSVNVVLYASINKSIKEVLSINNVDPSIIATDQEIANEYVEYTASEIFFMLQDIKEQLNVNGSYYSLDNYSPYRADAVVSLWKIGENSARYNWQSLSSCVDILTTNFDTYFSSDAKYRIEYVYDDEELGTLNAKNYKISNIKFIEL